MVLKFRKGIGTKAPNWNRHKNKIPNFFSNNMSICYSIIFQVFFAVPVPRIRLPNYFIQRRKIGSPTQMPKSSDPVLRSWVRRRASHFKVQEPHRDHSRLQSSLLQARLVCLLCLLNDRRSAQRRAGLDVLASNDFLLLRQQPGNFVLARDLPWKWKVAVVGLCHRNSGRRGTIQLRHFVCRNQRKGKI